MRVYSLEFTQAANFIVAPGKDGDPLGIEPDGSVRVEFDSPKAPTDFSHVGVVGIETFTAVSDRSQQVLEPLLGADATFIPLATDQASIGGCW